MIERIVSIVSGIFLLILIGFAWGWTALTFEIFPYSIVQSTTAEVSAFIEGGEGDKQLTVVEKLKSDTGGIPFRQLVDPVYRLSYDGCSGLSTRFIINKNCENIISSEIIKTGFSPQALAYGPHIDLVAGDYTAVFDLSIMAPTVQVVGYFDIVGIVDGEKTSFQRGSIYGSAGEKKELKLDFDLPEYTHDVVVSIFIEKPVESSVRKLTITRKPYWEDEKFSVVNFIGKNERRANPYIVKKQDLLFDDGLLFVFGAIDSEESLHGGMFLDREGEIVHAISINDDITLEKFSEYKKIKNTSRKYHPMETRFPHGVAVLPDGSIVFNDGDSGNSIRRVDWCGNEMWSRLGQTHHSITIEDNLAWHWEGVGLKNFSIVATNVETGEVEKRIPFSFIIRANPDVGPLKIRKEIKENRWLPDPHHPNDVEPLPAALVKDHPQFSEGDLLISLRSVDLVAVLDPDTLKIKWHRSGPFVRQHDPDWQKNGVITVFDNNMIEDDIHGASRIVSVRPDNYVSKIVYSGERHDVYTWMRGKHQVLSDGSMLLTIPQQGRVVMVNADGTLRFDFHNTFNDNKNLLLSEAIYLPAGYLNSDLMNRTCN